VGWVGLVCFESSGEDHVSFHIIFLAFSLNLHRFTCHVENTSFHFFVNTHLFTYEHKKCMYLYFMYVHIYRYVPTVGGFGGVLQDIFWADFGAIFLGQKNSDHASMGLSLPPLTATGGRDRGKAAGKEESERGTRRGERG